jgi:hypothetical protein
MSTNTTDMPMVKLESPRFEDSRPLLIAGLAGRYTLDDLPTLCPSNRRSCHMSGSQPTTGRTSSTRPSPVSFLFRQDA